MVAFIRKQGKVPTSEARTEIAKQRASLQLSLDEFHRQGFNLFPSLEAYDTDLGEIPYGDDIISDAEDDDPMTVPDVSRGNVEKLELPLPSTFSGRIPPELKAATEIEWKLRISQAEEALEGIRREICHKSYIYRSNVKLVGNKKGKQRGYAALHVADRALRHHIRIYKQARWSLQQLDSTSDDLDRLRELTNSDLQPLKSIYLPNDRGQSTIPIPWIWKLHVAEGLESEYLGECKFFSHLKVGPFMLTPPVYRINWLRARAKKLRWEEEIALIPREMEWTVLFFSHKSREWKGIADTSERSGQRSYAERQSAMWQGLSQQCIASFNTCRGKYSAEPLQTAT